MLTMDINDELEQKDTKNKQQVNHAVSFNATPILLEILVG